MTRTMFDAIIASNPPPGAPLYAGYDDGSWPDAAALAARFPGAIVVRVTVSAGDDQGQVLDVEQGDATPAQAPGWVVRRRAAGADPTVYCNTSTWASVQEAFASAGVPQPHYWVAQYDGNPAIPAGAVAKQYESNADYDTSAVADYWPGVDPSPTFQEETDMIMLSIVPSDSANPGIWLLSGGLYVGIDTPATVAALQAAGVQLASVDLDFHQRILAAVGAATAPAAAIADALAAAESAD